MNKLFLIVAFVPLFLTAQAKERIPYKSYDFLKLVNKKYTGIPIIEDAEKVKDIEGRDSYKIVDNDGDVFYLYDDNVIRQWTGKSYIELHQIGKDVVYYGWLIKDGKKGISFGVNGKEKEGIIEP